MFGHFVGDLLLLMMMMIMIVVLLEVVRLHCLSLLTLLLFQNHGAGAAAGK